MISIFNGALCNIIILLLGTGVQYDSSLDTNAGRLAQLVRASC